MKTLFQMLEDLAAATAEEIESFITGALETVDAVNANPSEFVGEDRTAAQLMVEMAEGVAAIEAARNELSSREEPVVDEIDTDALAELANRAHLSNDPGDETDAVDEPETPAAEVEETVEETETVEPVAEVVVDEPVAEVAEAPEPVTAAAPRTERKPLRRPARRQAAAPVAEEPGIALTAAAENLGFGLGQEIPDVLDVAKMMTKRRGQFGTIAEGTHGEKIPIAKADWRDRYGEERTLDNNDLANATKIEAVTASGKIRKAMDERKAEGGSLTASGGLCAPVTPYYNLQMISQADRPVRAALAGFNADRGGIRVASPAALTDITSAVGIISEVEDKAGGSQATKTCQVIACPEFNEVDVASIYHCLQFGNIGARTFPELVAQWNSLVLAAHARTAETALLDGISGASTQVTASDLGLGASATIPSQILTAAVGMRNRHRMDPQAVLRVLLPAWVLDLLVSDMYRTQFQRFDMSREQFVSVLRDANVEPSFYLDGATGASQVIGAQGAGALLAFPTTMNWFLYPEGSFLYLDGGTLELGLVRDSTLNSTNDFQIFGETWENVAYVGVESLSVTTTTCDSGTVSLPDSVGCPTSYS